jgi:hypothetical protein
LFLLAISSALVIGPAFCDDAVPRTAALSVSDNCAWGETRAVVRFGQ